jgi:signal transduction histidine kinase
MSITNVEAQERAQDYARDADLSAPLVVLRARRDEILERWLEVVARQPFHHGRREHAVADHIPALFDALVATLERGAPIWLEPEAPLDNPAVAEAAMAHAAARSTQGLQPADVVLEFRLLRQEIWHALRENLSDRAPTSDVLAAQLLLNDALDGAMGVGLTYFVGALEELKHDFLLTVAHDLRNPLTGLKGTAQLLSRQVRRTEPDLGRVQEGLAQIDAQATRISVLLAELLDVSRLRLGRFQIDRAPTEFRSIVDRVVERCAPDVAARLRIRIEDEGERLGQWDAARLEAVLENLLSNAIKFSPADSPIDVVVAATRDVLTVAVRDYGQGVDGDELARLFERFYRSPSAAEAGIDGSGLGLYIARGIVEAHGGSIWATSPGRDAGCTIHFTLPWQPTAVDGAAS